MSTDRSISSRTGKFRKLGRVRPSCPLPLREWRTHSHTTDAAPSTTHADPYWPGKLSMPVAVFAQFFLEVETQIFPFEIYDDVCRERSALIDIPTNRRQPGRLSLYFLREQSAISWGPRIKYRM